jgi:hypothetical protein
MHRAFIESVPIPRSIPGQRVTLTCGSPRLADVTDEALKTLVAEYPAGSTRRTGLFKVSRVMAHLGIIAAPLTTNHHNRDPWAQTLESVPAPWWDWALRWRRLSTLEPLTVSTRFSTILVAGRWAAEHHPEAVTPDQWTRTSPPNTSRTP